MAKIVCLICHHESVIAYLESDIADKRCQLSLGLSSEEANELRESIEKARKLKENSERIIYAVYKNQHHKDCGRI